MGLFGQSTPFDADIEKATSETNTNENWSLILDVCDKVSSNPRSAKECLKAIMKRMCHNDPHVVMQAITLLDACTSNCGRQFHLEVASREFENEFRRLLTKAQPKVSLKMRQVLKNWAENDFKSDTELNLIPSLYVKLRHEGHDFSNLNEKPAKSAAKVVVSKDPNVVSSQQEEEDIAKAIELSLKENKSSPKHQASSIATNTTAGYASLYPSFPASGSMGSITSTGGASNNSTTSQPEPRKVRALYDFEAAEENELTFFAGEIIHVLDDTDPNWWKGFNQRGDGLFPSNFVTADLSVEPERLDINQQNKSKKTVQFEDDAKELQQKTEAAAAAAANQRVEIDEAKVDRLLHLLHEANPEDPSQDSDEMLRLEQEVHQMGPLIDAELERVDRKHAQLTQLSSDLVDAINLYHSLMRDDRAAMMGGSGYMGNIPGSMPSMGYQGPPNPHMLYGAAGYPGASGNFMPAHAQLPQNYGMPSMPYANAGQMPTTTAPSVHNSPMAPPVGNNGYPPNTQLQMGTAPQAHMPIPMHFQNGHMTTPQLNGGLNSLPPHVNATIAPGQQAPPPQQIYATAQPGVAQPQNYQMLPQQQQQQPPQQQYAPPTQTTAATVMPPNAVAATSANSVHHQQQQHEQNNAAMQGQQAAHPQFMSPQHQQHQQQQQQQQQQHIAAAAYMQQQPYAAMPNGPQAYMTLPGGAGMAPGMMQQGPQSLPASGVNNHNSNDPNHIRQLQHQMAVVASMNQPVTQSFLVQNDTKNNIPIYQQQR